MNIRESRDMEDNIISQHQARSYVLAKRAGKPTEITAEQIAEFTVHTAVIDDNLRTVTKTEARMLAVYTMCLTLISVTAVSWIIWSQS